MSLWVESDGRDVFRRFEYRSEHLKAKQAEELTPLVIEARNKAIENLKIHVDKWTPVLEQVVEAGFVPQEFFSRRSFIEVKGPGEFYRAYQYMENITNEELGLKVKNTVFCVNDSLLTEDTLKSCLAFLGVMSDIEIVCQNAHELMRKILTSYGTLKYAHWKFPELSFFMTQQQKDKVAGFKPNKYYKVPSRMSFGDNREALTRFVAECRILGVDSNV